MSIKRTFILLFCNILTMSAFSQGTDFSLWEGGRHTYRIGGIRVTGSEYIDTSLLVRLSGLDQGDEVTLPGDDKIASAIDKLWSNNLFSDINIKVDRIVDNFVFLNINVKEIPRLNKKKFTGDITKAQVNELKDKTGLVNGRALTNASLKNAELAIRDYFVDKGYNRVKVDFKTAPEPSKVNYENLEINVDKGKRVRIENIYIGAVKNAYESTAENKLKDIKERMRFTLHPNETDFYYEDDDEPNNRNDYWNSMGFLSLTKTKEFLTPYINFNFFGGAKFDPHKIRKAESNLVDYYNSIGFRDAQIVKDTFYYNEAGNINVELLISEGDKYRFGDFYWRGNTKYDNDLLAKLLNIKKGEVYSKSYLNERLGMGGPGDGNDITSLYQDDGYLFFTISPVEKRINNDTIDFEFRITEGPQATIRNINIYGNDRTSDHVVRREIRTLPGNKYSRADIIRTMRELQNLGYFNPENIVPQPRPNPQDGSVDIDYTVEEKSTDQLQLSAGFGQNFSVYGTFAMSFNNFSLRNIKNPKTWDPLPMGDGQKFSIRIQSNGRNFNTESISFTEPWLGGKKPIALSVAVNRSFYSLRGNSTKNIGLDTSISQIGGVVGLQKRVKWPDDNFLLTTRVSYTRYNLRNAFQGGNSIFIDNFTNGTANNLNFGIGLSRYSIDNPLYPRYGSNISMDLTFTPPWSWFSDNRGKDYTKLTPEQKFKWVEYQKLKFTAEWYQKIHGNIVFKMAAKYGFMGYYNRDIGFAPFERFVIGGSGLSGLGGIAQMLLARDIYAQRGYEGPYGSEDGDPILNKYQFELRFPISLNPSSTIYTMAWFEAANRWYNYKNFNPFQLNRSVGVGVRVYLPMFGLLGVDYGLGLDRFNPDNPKLSSFANFTFMLGQEPQ